MRHLWEATYWTEKITVTKSSLEDIVWFYTLSVLTFKYFDSTFHPLLRSLPNILFSFGIFLEELLCGCQYLLSILEFLILKISILLSGTFQYAIILLNLVNMNIKLCKVLKLFFVFFLKVHDCLLHSSLVINTKTSILHVVDFPKMWLLILHLKFLIVEI